MSETFTNIYFTLFVKSVYGKQQLSSEINFVKYIFLKKLFFKSYDQACFCYLAKKKHPFDLFFCSNDLVSLD